jgi:hypothetical protein
VISQVGSKVQGYSSDETVVVVSSGIWSDSGSFPVTAVKKVATVPVEEVATFYAGY